MDNQTHDHGHTPEAHNAQHQGVDPAAHPAHPAHKHAVVVNFDNKLDYKEAKFGFRTMEDASTGVKTKRATVSLDKIPVPSVEGIIEIMTVGGKALDLLLEAVGEVVFDAARNLINSNEALTSENFDYSQLDWNIIANLEKEDRRSGISKETWDEFAADYASIMPAISGSTKEQALNAAKIFAGKFASIKGKKDVIGKLQLRLAMYLENTPKAADFAECVDFLNKKAKKLIEAKEENLADNLGLD